MNQEQIVAWLDTHTLTPIQVDCVVTVMLKILDGKCKMRSAEKVVIVLLYDLIKTNPGSVLSKDLHPLIATARYRNDDQDLKMLVYEKRLLAETTISRPVMKQFKAFIRAEGLLDDAEGNDEDAEIN